MFRYILNYDYYQNNKIQCGLMIYFHMISVSNENYNF